ncbi:MAG: deoxyribonuclease V [candidate division KSB1 bacterium]|nr:deoxyribonuclease V [candidate division KSB1 bacterium]MDZ7319617.1 deoxyribonuclease V [candidate division KSB1 bacterium]MDZ7340413.1 deoxyribonuclease V [candidate division KSB1 bacterium]
MMKVKKIHPWNVTLDQAKDIQLALQPKIVLQPLLASPHWIAGADVAYSREGGCCFAAVTVFAFPAMTVVEQQTAMANINFPYVPGYLTFREAPALILAFEKISQVPDLIIFDGQGIAHPRGLGIASHLGLLLDRPAIGCAKSVLVGNYELPLPTAGHWTKLMFQGRGIGAVVRTRNHVKPLYISPGFKITLEEAIHWVLTTCRGFRLPEPIRKSHATVNQMRVNYDRSNHKITCSPDGPGLS